MYSENDEEIVRACVPVKVRSSMGSCYVPRKANYSDGQILCGICRVCSLEHHAEFPRS